ncbi:MAG: ribokinase [Chitinophagaceae bacterium]
MITVIGSSNVDLVIQVPKIPDVGETILGGKFQQIFGGKGANQAIAAKRAEGTVFYITKLGQDTHGDQFKNHFQNENMDVSGILFDSNELTGIAQIWVSEKGENSIVVAPGANMKLLPNDFDLFNEQLHLSNFILMQMEIPIDTIVSVTEKVSNLGGKIILNPAPAQHLPAAIWKHLWMITPNEAEASLLTAMPIHNSNDIIEAANKLLKKGVHQVLITMGEKGCFWTDGNEEIFFPAFDVMAVDSTAAGDVFNGALTVALDEGQPLIKAINFASAAAALSVSKLGAQTSIPFRSEIEKFILDRSSD